jgi:hypothetical protein
MLSKSGKHIFLVGVAQDDDSVKNIRVFTNQTWAIKAGKEAGVHARYAEIEIDWQTTPPEPRPELVVAAEKKSKKTSEASAN